MPKALQQLVGLAAMVNMAVGWVLALHMVVGLEQKAVRKHGEARAGSRVIRVMYMCGKEELQNRATQGHTGPQGSLGIPRKPYFYLFFEILGGIFGIFDQILRFLIKIT